MAKKEVGKKNTGFCKNLFLTAAVAKIRLMIQAFVPVPQDSGLQNPYPRNPDKKFEFCRLMRHWFHPVQQPTPASRIPDILSGAHP
jgi:hypothetical protein